MPFSMKTYHFTHRQINMMIYSTGAHYNMLIMCVFSHRYFNALSKDECLPVKDRLEMNVATQKTDTGLTPGLLKTLHKQVLTIARPQLKEPTISYFTSFYLL
uniref:Uncharacterized protein n=1 Tax=Labrus bergylta TaxID=56723 RepID=A0A3Q3FEG6_9LABR